MSVEKKVMAGRIMEAFSKLDAGYGSDVDKAMQRTKVRLTVPRPSKPANPNESFANPGELVWIVNDDGKFVQIPWKQELENIRKESGC